MSPDWNLWTKINMGTKTSAISLLIRYPQDSYRYSFIWRESGSIDKDAETEKLKKENLKEHFRDDKTIAVTVPSVKPLFLKKGTLNNGGILKDGAGFILRIFLEGWSLDQTDQISERDYNNHNYDYYEYVLCTYRYYLLPIFSSN
jgi:hypothetical protein